MIPMGSLIIMEFYQWFPLGPVHGLKILVPYEVKEPWNRNITPEDQFDSHGAYSGSSIEHNDKLHLFYTGNTRDKTWARHPYQ